MSAWGEVTAPRRARRPHASSKSNVRATVDACRRRDAKGVHAAAPRGLPGVDVAYEPPEAPDIVADGRRDRAAVALILAALRRAWEPDR